jgi:UDP-glucose 4-epimerase
MLIARSARLQDVLDWHPQYDDLDFIVGTAFRWEQKMVRQVEHVG